MFDFNKVAELRKPYLPGLFSNKENTLFQAIQNDEYKYDFVLLDNKWLEENKKIFFDTYHPDVMIKINSVDLENFILVHLNTNKPSKILIGEFVGDATAVDKSAQGKTRIDKYIGKHNDDFSDFQDNILKFVNGDKIKRDDMNVIKYSEFDIKHIHPSHYTKQAIQKRNKIKIRKEIKEQANVFDFNKALWFRKKHRKLYEYEYEYDDKYDGINDNLLQAIQNNEYEYEYALFNSDMFEYGFSIQSKRDFFNVCHPDIVIEMNLNHERSFILVRLNKKVPSKILIGKFEGQIGALRDLNKNHYDFDELLEKYTDDFCDLQYNILKFVNGDKIERDDMAVIEYSKFDIYHTDPSYYTKQKIKIKNKTTEKEYKFLRDYVDMIYGPIVSDVSKKCLTHERFIYPLDCDKIKEKKLGEVIKIQKGDIICAINGKCDGWRSGYPSVWATFYLYDSDYDDIYVDRHEYRVLRCKDERYASYLVNYLNSKLEYIDVDKARDLLFKEDVYLDDIDEVDLNDIYNLDKSYVLHDFRNEELIDLLNTKIDDPTEEALSIIDRTQEYTMNSEKMTLAEMNDFMRKSYQKKLKNLIDKDLKEVDICFENGAYKSAIVLCGSILEGFLLDWLAECENADDISDVAKDEDGSDLTLDTIIDMLKSKIKPRWDEVNKAYEIKRARNIIHPKICIKNQDNLNEEEECKKIIKHLKDIMAFRIKYDS